MRESARRWRYDREQRASEVSVRTSSSALSPHPRDDVIYDGGVALGKAPPPWPARMYGRLGMPAPDCALMSRNINTARSRRIHLTRSAGQANLASQPGRVAHPTFLFFSWAIDALVQWTPLRKGLRRICISLVCVFLLDRKSMVLVPCSPVFSYS